MKDLMQDFYAIIVEQITKERESLAGDNWLENGPPPVAFESWPLSARMLRAALIVTGEVRRDADRYRWLRDEDSAAPEPLREIAAVQFRSPFTDDLEVCLYGEDLDFAIDNIMLAAAQ